MSKKTKFAVLVAVLAGVLVLANFDMSSAQVPGGKMMTYVLEGNYRVKFECAFIDKKTQKGMEEQVKKIEFHPEYIVLIKQTGDGRLVPVHAIKELTWEPS